MVFLNDPLSCPKQGLRAVAMVVEMQRDVGGLIESWRKSVIALGLGIGMAPGDATLGRIGSHDQFRYAAIGEVASLASRSCDEATSGDILTDRSVNEEIAPAAETVCLGARTLTGFPDAVPVFRLVELRREPEALIGRAAS